MNKEERISTIKEIKDDYNDIVYWMHKEIDLDKLNDRELQIVNESISRIWMVFNKKIK